MPESTQAVYTALTVLSSNRWLFIRPPSRIVQSSILISGRYETHFPTGLSFCVLTVMCKPPRRQLAYRHQYGEIVTGRTYRGQIGATQTPAETPAIAGSTLRAICSAILSTVSRSGDDSGGRRYVGNPGILAASPALATAISGIPRYFRYDLQPSVTRC